MRCLKTLNARFAYPKAFTQAECPGMCAMVHETQELAKYRVRSNITRTARVNRMPGLWPIVCAFLWRINLRHEHCCRWARVLFNGNDKARAMQDNSEECTTDDHCDKLLLHRGPSTTLL